MNRQRPQSIESEKALIGSALLGGRILEELSGKVKNEYFAHPAHQIIWQTLVVMESRGMVIHLVSLTEELEKAGQLEKVGGSPYITELFTTVPTASGFEYYLASVRDKMQARQAIEVAESILEAAYNPAMADNIAEIAQEGLVKISGITESQAETKHIKGIVMRRLDRLEEIARSGPKIEGIPTGLGRFDQMTRGLRPGNVIVLAAQTKGGKTTLALNIALNVAEAGYNVGIFSLEMHEGELADSLIAAKSGVDISESSASGISERDIRRIMGAIDDISKTGIYVRDESVITPAQFRAAARKLVAQQGCKLLIVDYLQLMEPASRGDNRERQVAESSRTIKTTAAELGVPVIVLSQLNDDGRSRESRAIENDSNIFAVIEEDDDGHWLNLKLTRDCRSGRIPVTFRKEIRRFSERIIQ